MPTVLGPPYSPLWRGIYPHMLAEDRPIWDRFLQQNSGLFTRVYYDVRLGGILEVPLEAADTMQRMYYDVTAKRIDALAELEKEIWIIEVSAKPGLRAVGQLQTYMALWFKDPKINKPAVGVLVAQAIDSDLQHSLEFYGMRTRLIG